MKSSSSGSRISSLSPRHYLLLLTVRTQQKKYKVKVDADEFYDSYEIVFILPLLLLMNIQFSTQMSFYLLLLSFIDREWEGVSGRCVAMVPKS